MIAPLALGVLALALAWPVPLLLARARWPHRAPAVALVLWQSIAIAGGLSMIGALLTFGLAPFGHDLVSGIRGFLAQGPATIEFANALALGGAVLLTGHLLLNLALTIVSAERQRRRHAQLLMLLSSPHPSGSRLIDTPAPVAYCLPGALSSVTVVSAGLIALLDDEEMRAVIEHEKAHVRQRHDVVLMLFRAWYTSLPWFPIAFRAQREVGMLIEMLADDRARAVVPDEVLARAIVLVGAGRHEGPALASVRDWGDAASGDDLRARISRLSPEVTPLARPAELAIVAIAAALLVVPTVLLLAPSAGMLLAA